MTQTLLSIFPDPKDLLALEPEELGGVILEIAPGVAQNGIFNVHSLLAQLFHAVGPSYPNGMHFPVSLALAEALSWLVSTGLLVLDPGQPAQFYRLTRRATSLRTVTAAGARGRNETDGASCRADFKGLDPHRVTSKFA